MSAIIIKRVGLINLMKITREYILYEENLAETFLKEYMEKDVVILKGCGIAAYWYMKFLRANNVAVSYIVDKNMEKQGQLFCDVPIVSSQWLAENVDINKSKIIIATPKYREEVYSELRIEFGEKARIYSFEAEIYYSFLHDIPAFRQYIYNNYDKIEYLEERLEDKKSVETLWAFLQGRISANQDYFVSVMEENQYFPEGIIDLGENETIVELGSNDGKTLLSMLNKVKRQYNKIFCFEPDRECVKTLKKIINEENGNIVLVEKGVWSESKKLGFVSDAEHGASKIAEVDVADYCIDVVAIDDVINEKITYLKMDIEGVELNALKGAEKIIRGSRPKLAICVYHNQEDMLDIVEWIDSLDLDYKLYLRHHNWGATETVLYAV